MNSSKNYSNTKSPHKFQQLRYLLVGFIFISLLVIVLMSGSASAEFKGENDWNNSDRTLCYKLDSSVTEKWSGWIEEAIQNWNNVSSQTGWSFHECQQGEKTQVEFELSDDNRANGGAEVKPVPFPDPIDKLTIHIDKNLSDETWPGGVKVDGWSKTGNDTLDPVLVLKHELSHIIRLDHSGGIDTGNLEDPIGPGNHNNPPNREPSSDDIKEAKNASKDKKGWGKKKNIGFNGGEFFHMGNGLIVSRGSLVENVTIELSPITRTHIPDPTKLDTGSTSNSRGIISAVKISNKTKNIQFSPPATVSISYTEDDISGGYILGMRHSKIFPAIREQSLRAYRYNKTKGIWTSKLFEINQDTNNISFQTNKLGIFGVGGETSITSLYDEDNNGQIERNELRSAIIDFVNREIDRSELRKIIIAYIENIS